MAELCNSPICTIPHPHCHMPVVWAVGPEQPIVERDDTITGHIQPSYPTDLLDRYKARIADLEDERDRLREMYDTAMQAGVAQARRITHLLSLLREATPWIVAARGALKLTLLQQIDRELEKGDG